MNSPLDFSVTRADTHHNAEGLFSSYFPFEEARAKPSQVT